MSNLNPQSRKNNPKCSGVKNTIYPCQTKYRVASNWKSTSSLHSSSLVTISALYHSVSHIRKLYHCNHSSLPTTLTTTLMCLRTEMHTGVYGGNERRLQRAVFSPGPSLTAIPPSTRAISSDLGSKAGSGLVSTWTGDRLGIPGAVSSFTSRLRERRCFSAGDFQNQSTVFKLHVSCKYVNLWGHRPKKIVYTTTEMLDLPAFHF